MRLLVGLLVLMAVFKGFKRGYAVYVAGEAAERERCLAVLDRVIDRYDNELWTAAARQARAEIDAR